jgi:lactosylceramide 4-alpha-galactosyltransferase
MMNPDQEVFLFYMSQVGYETNSDFPLVEALLTYSNINLNYFEIVEYAKETPFEELVNSDRLSKSRWPLEHTSDILRFLTLWKFGGTYMDLDTVTIKPLKVLEPNFAGTELVDGSISTGIINLEGETGHEIADMFVNEFDKNYDGSSWV